MGYDDLQSNSKSSVELEGPTIGRHTLGTLEARKQKIEATDIPKCDKRLASDHPVYKDFICHTAEFFLHT